MKTLLLIAMMVFITHHVHAETWSEWTDRAIKEAAIKKEAEESARCTESVKKLNLYMGTLAETWTLHGPSKITRMSAHHAKQAWNEWVNNCEWKDDTLSLGKKLSDFIDVLPPD